MVILTGKITRKRRAVQAEMMIVMKMTILKKKSYGTLMLIFHLEKLPLRKESVKD
jgi:hypothetical protein